MGFNLAFKGLIHFQRFENLHFSQTVSLILSVLRMNSKFLKKKASTN